MPLGVEQIARAVAKRAQRGLYAGRTVLFGNRVSKDGGNRTRRKWLPNVQRKRMYSEQLQEMVPLRLTTGAIRNIDKAGGLDAYLFKIENTREDSAKAAQLRQQISLHRAQQEHAQQEETTQLELEERRRLKAARTMLLPAAAAALGDPGSTLS